jgi:hypothetical protein
VNTHPAIVFEEGPLYLDANEEPHGKATEIAAYRPTCVMVVPLVDHAGSHREDGWRIRIDLSDGRRGYLTFSRRKLWRSEKEIDLGVCDKVYASIVIDGEVKA